MTPLEKLLPWGLVLLANFGPWLVRRWFRRLRDEQQGLSRQQGQATPGLRALDTLSTVARALFVAVLVVFVAGFGLCGGWGLLNGLEMIGHAGEQRAYGQMVLVLGSLGLVLALASLVKLLVVLKNLFANPPADRDPTHPDPPAP